jgi:uncharacterized membrane protein YbhN (UPF0104 family)
VTRSRVLLAAQAIGTVALLAFVFSRLDWKEFRAVMGLLTPQFYVASLLAALFGQIAYAVRWHQVLAGLDVNLPFLVVLRQHFIALFFSNVLPTAVGGDAAKIYYVGKVAGFTNASASVFVDRFLGLYWLAVLGGAFAAASTLETPVFRTTTQVLVGLAAALTLLIVVSVIAPDFPDHTGNRWRGRATRLVARVRDAMRRRSAVIYAAVVVIAYQLLIAWVYTEFFRLNGASDPALVDLLAALFGMAVAVNLPISINGVGLREQLHVMIFSSMGLGAEAAVGISLLMFAHALLLSLVGGVAWLALREKSA